MKNKKGSIFILSILFAVTVAVAVISLVSLQLNFHKISVKSLDRVVALYNAESAIQLALHELRHKTATDRWAGWTISGNTYSIVKDGIEYIIESNNMPTT